MRVAFTCLSYKSGILFFTELYIFFRELYNFRLCLAISTECQQDEDARTLIEIISESLAEFCE